jgi:hypothetical protein
MTKKLNTKLIAALKPVPGKRLVVHDAVQRGLAVRVTPIRTCWQEFSAQAPAMAAYYKLRLITAQRGIEVASMKWSDLDPRRRLVGDSCSERQEQAVAPRAVVLNGGRAHQGDARRRRLRTRWRAREETNHGSQTGEE